MTTYENAPATRLLATRCACCGRALVDAQSVERGIGPDCAEKYGFLVEISEAARVEANALVYKIAAEPEASTVAADVERIRALGLSVLADKLTERLVPEPTITIEPMIGSGGWVEVHTPYSDRFVSVLKAGAAWGDRKWNRERRAWQVGPAAKGALNTALVAAFAGERAKGPRGAFTIGSASPAPAPVAEPAPTSYASPSERATAPAGLDAIPVIGATDAAAFSIAEINRASARRAIVGAIGEFEKVATAPEFAAALNLLRAARERLLGTDDAQPPAEAIDENGDVDCERWASIEALRSLSTADHGATAQRAFANLSAGEGSFSRDRSVLGRKFRR